MYCITLFISDCEYTERFITVPKYITLKVVLHESNDILLIKELFKLQNFIVFEQLCESEFINFACEMKIEEAENYQSVSSKQQITELNLSKLYSPLFEFNFKPVDFTQHYTFKNKLELSLLDQNGDCVQFVQRDINIVGEYEL